MREHLRWLSVLRARLRRRKAPPTRHPTWDGVSPVKHVARPVFVTASGRSGTHFLGRAFELCSGVESYHLDDGQPLADGFTCWAAWQRLGMDLAPSMAHRAERAQASAMARTRYVESNPLLAANVRDLLDLFPDASFVVPLRDPKKVVESHARKGWYAAPDTWTTRSWPYAYRDGCSRELHGYSRILPLDAEKHAAWVPLPQVGKLGWMWAAYNGRLIRDLAELAPERSFIVRLEQLDAQGFASLARRLGMAAGSDAAFDALLSAPPGSGPKTPVPWTSDAIAAFEAQVEPLERLRTSLGAAVTPLADIDASYVLALPAE